MHILLLRFPADWITGYSGHLGLHFDLGFRAYAAGLRKQGVPCMSRPPRYSTWRSHEPESPTRFPKRSARTWETTLGLNSIALIYGSDSKFGKRLTQKAPHGLVFLTGPLFCEIPSLQLQRSDYMDNKIEGHNPAVLCKASLRRQPQNKNVQVG